MSKYFEILINGEFKKSFSGSKELEATNLYNQLILDKPKDLIKLILHRRTEIKVFRNGLNNTKSNFIPK
jgi:hypothetical protein